MANTAYGLLKEVSISYGSNAAAAGTTDQDSAVLDMSDYNSLLIIAKLGDATSGSVLKLRAFGNTASSTSSPTPVEITTDNVQYTASTSDADNKLLVLDIPRWNPTYQYAFGRLVIDTQNCVSDGLVMIRYNPRSVPITQGSTVIASAQLAPAG